ncbi:hypothetical protein OGAPHI_004562 [Ogataea philodendri]|uniref:Uncharacterized protein n=1 Tax=Ogataea philodendri TaxID=1378263 RepID=A0A9P8P377_9ASCO|nr:uncharacterized protein OGAPHI_004562 [Ogataea philodendri]KAH3664211.1 hypothetical protein OGAPHI_004562 [Ogataea philodendri]
MIHRVPLNTFPLLMVFKEMMSLWIILLLRSGNFSTTCLTNVITSEAAVVLSSGMKSRIRSTTLAATSWNWMAHVWMAEINSCLYSVLFSSLEVVVFCSSFLSSLTTSSTFLLDTSDNVNSIAFSLTSSEGEERTLRMSRHMSCKRSSFLRWSSSTISRAMSLTLLSGSLTASSMNLEAALVTATWELDKTLNVEAAS